MHSLSVRIALVLGICLAFGVGVAGIATAGAAEPLRIAQAGTADEDAEATATSDAEPRPSSPPPRGDIEEIVVQAGESDAVADLEAGDSVTGFDASDLEALGAQSIEDLAGFTPNLEIVTSGATTPTFFIRGVGLNDFNPNSSGSVAIYTDDVAKNSPALQLGTLFDVEAVNVLRGPQGTGPFRSASAGAIKVYSREPSGEFGGYLRSELGNYNWQDFEGAVEMPVFQDVLAGRFAFRYSARDGYATNNCGGVPPASMRPVYESTPGNIVPQLNTDLIRVVTPALVNEVFQKTGFRIQEGFSYCGERVVRKNAIDSFGTGLRSPGYSLVPAGLPDKVNDLGNWATRGMLRFQPTLDQDWLLIGNMSKRNEYSRLGQAIGTGMGPGNPHWICDLDLPESMRSDECRVSQTLGTTDGAGYRAIEVLEAAYRADPCTLELPSNQRATDTGYIDTSKCIGSTPQETTLLRDNSRNATKIAREDVLGNLDDEPHVGDYNRVGRTRNDTWGASLKGEIALGDSMQLRTVSGFDTYDRSVDTDLDFSPNTLFEIYTKDEGWQFMQDLELSGTLSQELPIGWNMGAFLLREKLQTQDCDYDLSVQSCVSLNFPLVTRKIAVIRREWEQNLLSLAAYAGFDWDFWDDFTLDGGVRYNWEKKKLDLTTFQELQILNDLPGKDFSEDDIWQDPTGEIRLTYRFREDTHAYWKYSRGWKGGHYNVTANQIRGITTAEPETIDSFEMGVRGSWFNGRLSMDTSVFHYAYKNYQIFTVQIPLVGNPEFVVLNANNAEVYGGEVDLTARPLPGLFLQARFSWLESQFLDFVQTQAQTLIVGNQRDDVVTPVDNSGNRLLNSPEFKVSVTAEQTLPLGRFGSLTGRWDGAWTDDTYYDPTEGRGLGDFNGNKFLPPNTIGQEAFWLHNFRLDYRTPDGSITIGAWVRNATDEVYKTFAFDASPLAINRTTIYFVGVPRTYGGSLTVNF